MMSPNTAYVTLHLLGTIAATSWWAPMLEQFPAGTPIVAVSGLAGGITRMIADRQRFWVEGLGSIVAGGLIATFMWPVAHPGAETVIGKFDMEPGSALMFGGFITGLLGISIPLFILDMFRARTKRRLDEENDRDA